MLIMIVGIVLIPFFIYASITSFKFSKSEGFKNESGKMILAKSSQNALYIFPIGLIVMEIFHRFIVNIPYETYRDSMIVLMLLLVTVQGFSIRYYRKLKLKE